MPKLQRRAFSRGSIHILQKLLKNKTILRSQTSLVPWMCMVNHYAETGNPYALLESHFSFTGDWLVTVAALQNIVDTKLLHRGNTEIKPLDALAP